MAFACIPFLVAVSSKANVITLLTGISHENLNVIHRWVAWMSFALSLLHALPYFIASYKVWPPSNFSWIPGQHTFLRFPLFAPLESHPFTIISAPMFNLMLLARKRSILSESIPLIFLVCGYDGFTRRLAT